MSAPLLLKEVEIIQRNGIRDTNANKAADK